MQVHAQQVPRRAGRKEKEPMRNDNAQGLN